MTPDSATARSDETGMTVPVGLLGEFTRMALVFFERALRIDSGRKAKPSSSRTGTRTGTAPAKEMMFG